MNLASVTFGLVVADASGVDRQRGLEIGLLAGVADVPPMQTAMLTIVLARSLGSTSNPATSTAASSSTGGGVKALPPFVPTPVVKPLPGSATPTPTPDIPTEQPRPWGHQEEVHHGKPGRLHFRKRDDAGREDG